MIDVLIIGSGGAGLTAALSAKEAGASVLVVGKAYPTNSQTSMAQGGINAALGNVGEDHVIEWLEQLGVPFSRLDNGKSGKDTVAQHQMGGASAKRACYAQDYTGLKILHTLYDTCLKENIEFLDEHYLLNLIIKDSLYHGFTTNAYGSTGDGVAAVLRAGGAVSDMEFIQFHPTALKHSAILISESARGEGGYLLNSDGERFVDELKPRDEVARAIFAQLQNNKDVFLDLRHLGEEKLMEILPQEVALCKLHEHVDPSSELIPIKPVAHYSMGGIDVDYALEVTGIKGCFAVGECSNAKVHGANRLGGNSLLEITAFGKFAGENAYKHSIYASSKPADDGQLKIDTVHIEELFKREVKLNFYAQREALGKLFYSHVGIVRENSKLNEALEKVITMQVALPQMGIKDKAKENNQNLVEFLEFSNALLLAPTTISAAIARDESRGAHYKLGFEKEDNENFAKHMVLQWKKETE
jgi:succinate dehydrogenase / fumarate reductase flavoprotein subunit